MTTVVPPIMLVVTMASVVMVGDFGEDREVEAARKSGRKERGKDGRWRREGGGRKVTEGWKEGKGRKIKEKG